MKNIVIIGASGHGGMILDCIEKEGRYHVLGFIDSFKEKGTEYLGYEILGNEGKIMVRAISISSPVTKKDTSHRNIHKTPLITF
jgi:FlaA1/EpsC-like NDP-sugar epimerase